LAQNALNRIMKIGALIIGWNDDIDLIDRHSCS
jgi:hypothetical protein